MTYSSRNNMTNSKKLKHSKSSAYELRSVELCYSKKVTGIGSRQKPTIQIINTPRINSIILYTRNQLAGSIILESCSCNVFFFIKKGKRKSNYNSNSPSPITTNQISITLSSILSKSLILQRQ